MFVGVDNGVPQLPQTLQCFPNIAFYIHPEREKLDPKTNKKFQNITA